MKPARNLFLKRLAAALSFTALTFASTAFAQSGGFTSFSVPNSTGTFASDISSSGAVTGYYTTADQVNHGYVRGGGGLITTFDVAGAGTAAGQGTSGLAINSTGTVAGSYQDGNSVFHGFVRGEGGNIVTFDVTGAGTAAHQGTFTADINSAGTVTGHYIDSTGAAHGFVRGPGTQTITFDVTGAGTALNQGTVATAINDSNTVVGYYIDATNILHGFTRGGGGTITTFDVTGASLTEATDVANSTGSATGSYTDQLSGMTSGFVRGAGGMIQTFSITGASTASPVGITSGGNVVGRYQDAMGTHGFLRGSGGSQLITFDIAIAQTGSTFPNAINDSNAITGNYLDTNLVSHAFIWIPQFTTPDVITHVQ